MHAQAALTILALVAVALSGCMGDEPGTKPLDTETPTGTTDGGNETTDGNTTQEPGDNATAPNTPPTAELTASETNGTAPLNVTFTLDGSDADGDELAWTFTVGNVTEEGTALPATVDATLDAGNWSATLTVSDGVDEAVARATVEAAGSAEPVVFTGASASGSSPTARDTAGVSPCMSFLLLENGLDCYYFTVPEELVGRPFTVESSAGSADVGFWADCDPLFYAHVANEYSGAGTVPDGTGCAVLWYFGLAPDGVEFTFTVL